MSLTLTQGFIFLLYVTFLWIKFKGPLPSISESWYRLKDLGGTWYSLFTWFCFSIGFLMFFQTNDTAPYLFILSGAGLSFVGVATMFKETKSLEPYIHTIGAVVCIVSALFGIAIERNSWLPMIIFAILAILIKLFKVKNSTWWTEIAAFLTILGGLLIY